MRKQLALTKAGLENARQRLAKLEEDLTRVLSQKHEAAETGGKVWHDNFAFEELQREEIRLRQQIQELKLLLKEARVVEESGRGGRVSLGSWVSLRFPNQEVRRFKIVGGLQADPARQLISQDSPLGAAVMGAVRGEQRTFRAGSQGKTVVVEKVE